MTTEPMTRGQRAPWLEWRRQGIGASDAAAIMGLDPFSSPFAKYLEKTGEIVVDETAPMRWGTLLEQPIATAFEQEEGYVVRRRQAMVTHPTEPWMRATLDGLVFRPTSDGRRTGHPLGVYESKATFRRAVEWAGEEPPLYYQIQVQHQLAVTEMEQGWLVGLTFTPVPHLHVHVIERDQEVIDDLMEAEAEFWARVKERRPPPADGSPATTEAIRQAYAEVEQGTTIDLEPDRARTLIVDRTSAKADQKAAEERVRSAENALKAMLAEHEVGLVDGLPLVTWKSQTRAGYTVEPATYRVLRTKGEK